MGVVTFLNGAASLLLLGIDRIDVDVQVCCIRESCDDIIIPAALQNFTHHPKSEIIIKCNNATQIKKTFSNSIQNGTCPSDAKSMCSARIPRGMDTWLGSFASYLTIRVILDVLRASSLMLFEGAVVVIIKEHGGDYGLQVLIPIHKTLNDLDQKVE